MAFEMAQVASERSQCCRSNVAAQWRPYDQTWPSLGRGCGHRANVWPKIGSVLAAGASEKIAKERRRFVRNAGEFVGCLPIEFEIELSAGPAVIPVCEGFEFGATQMSLGMCGASDANAHSRGLAGNAALLGNCLYPYDHAARNETASSFVLAREHEHHVAFRDLLTAIHGLLRVEYE